MPTITVKRKVFEKYVGKKLPTEELKNRISYLGTDLDSVTDEDIEVEIFPNRPDLLSVQGFARAFASFIGTKPELKEYKVKKSGEKVIIDKSVKNVRPYTACAIVKGIKYDHERIIEVVQIQEKLHVTYGRNRRKAAIGIYPFEKIKTPITFCAKKPENIKFQPLEASKIMNGRQILSQHPTGKDYGHLLEKLDKYPIFVDANDEILSMPPIVNSHTTGKINEHTQDVFIECSGFDFEVLQKCLNMIVTALADMGGEIYSMDIVYPDKTYVTPNLKPTTIKIDPNYINKRLGLNLNEKEFKTYLAKMGFDYKNKTAYIPAYRTDILHQIDIAEDIAIAYGFDKFEAIIPRVATIGQEDPFEVMKNKIAEILVGLGLQEINTYNLTNKENQVTKMNVNMPMIELANSLSQEYNMLRAWMIPTMLETLKNNKHHDYPHKIFGTGTVFKKDTSQETNILEQDRLGVAICSDKSDFTEIKQILDYLFRMLDVKYEIVETTHDSFIPGRIGRVLVKGKKVAYIGEISPIVLENFNLEMPTGVFELNLTELFKLIEK